MQIGNSDDKLTQREWAHFIADVRQVVNGWSSHPGTPNKLHGEWFSLPDMEHQNACWLVELHADDEDAMSGLRDELAALCDEYRQASIAWTAGVTEFIHAPERMVRP